MNSAFPIQSLDLKTIDMGLCTQLTESYNRLHTESHPDDPPIAAEEHYRSWHALPPFVDVLVWIAWNTDHTQIIGASTLELARTEDNQHVGQCDVAVLPEYRRQGLGRRLLTLIVETAQREQRRLLFFVTNDNMPAGEALMNRLGAQRGLESHTNQLRIEDLDRSLVSQWLHDAEQNTNEFTLGFWDGSYPEDQIEAVIGLWDLTNQQPKGDLEFNDAHFTPEQIRQMEQQLQARGSQRWTYYIIERSTGKYAGYTEVFWNPARPQYAGQGMTGVFPEYRNRGLGRWLKAVMLDKILKERPQVKFVRTGNANDNAPMLKINTKLGFKPYLAQTIWQIETERVAAYTKK